MKNKLLKKIRNLFKTPEPEYELKIVNRTDLHPCIQCEYSVMVNFCGKCKHPNTSLVMLPNEYWFYNRPNSCPLINKKIK